MLELGFGERLANALAICSGDKAMPPLTPVDRGRPVARPREDTGHRRQVRLRQEYVGRPLVRLIEVDSGQIHFAGEDVRALQGDALRRYNRRVQLVFQDPYGSLNPRMTVGAMLDEALQVHHIIRSSRRTARVAELVSLARLPVDATHEFSGGQPQRDCPPAILPLRLLPGVRHAAKVQRHPNSPLPLLDGTLDRPR